MKPEYDLSQHPARRNPYAARLKQPVTLSAPSYGNNMKQNPNMEKDKDVTASAPTTIQEVIKRTAEEYQKIKKGKKLGDNVFRGRSTPCAYRFEEILAQYIGFRLNDHTIYVDQRISFEKQSKYPDILITKENKVVAIIEVKIDLGYLRQEWVEERDELFRRIRTNGIININKEDYESKSLQSATIILTAQNAHNNMDLFNNDPNVFILLSKDHVHPNALNKDEELKDFFSKVESIGNGANKDWVNLDQFIESIKGQP